MPARILNALLCAAVLAWQAARSRRLFHMLQLNSYYNERYFSWLRKNPQEWQWWMGLMAAGVLLLLPANKGGLGVGLMLFAVAASFPLLFRRPEKKPFVVTERVERQFKAGFVMLLVLGVAGLAAAHALLDALAPWLARSATLPHGAFFTPLPEVGATLYNTLWIGKGAAAMLAVLPPALLPPLCNAVMSRTEQRISQGFIDQARERLSSALEITVVGITGSYGKTSVKHILAELLQEKYNTLMTPESYNTTMGVVRTINEQLRPYHQVFLCEMGARQMGDIAEICDIVKPKYGVITSVGIAHLESFRTTENILRTKFELAHSLPADGIAFLNVDSTPVKDAAYDRPHVNYGLDGSCDYYATDIAYDEHGASFLLHHPHGQPVKLLTKLLGRHNVLNIVGAAAVAMTMGVTTQQIAFALRRLQPVPHRLELRNNGGVIVIDDAYNANPEGAAEAVAVLGSMQSRTRIMVTPGMVELGDRQREANREFGKIAAQHCDHVVAVGPNAPVLIEGLTAGGMPESRRHTVKNLREALALLPSLMDGPCALLLENDLTDDLENG